MLKPIAVFSLCLAALTAGPAFAQVTVDLHALDSPPGSGANPPEAPAPHKPVPHRPPSHRTTAAKPAKPGTAQQGTTQQGAGQPKPPPPATTETAPAPPKPVAPTAPAAPPAPEPPAAVIGTAPPPVPVIPPPAAPDAPMAPEPPLTVSTTAATTVAPLPSKDGAGVRLDFGTGESDLTQGTADAVRALVAAAPKTDDTTFNVMAYAAGVPEDPSTARRLSLSRALAVRTALMAFGVPSTHIYVKALGAQGGEEGPADRVDVLVMGANNAASAPGAAASAATPPAKTATP